MLRPDRSEPAEHRARAGHADLPRLLDQLADWHGFDPEGSDGQVSAHILADAFLAGVRAGETGVAVNLQLVEPAAA